MEKKVCVVVGLGPGVGVSVARAFAAEGYTLALVARTPSSLERHREELVTGGANVHVFPADAGSEASLGGALDRVREEVGDPEVLVYNAAVLGQIKPSALPAEKLVADFHVNVVGALVAAQRVLPAMRARGKGTILFTGGGLALNPWPDFASLAIGKTGLRSLALMLSKELAGEGIHVATVTICGLVKPGTHFDPDKIAASFIELHRQEAGKFEAEVIYK